MTQVVVLAGNYKQYADWCHANGIGPQSERNVRYIYTKYTLDGLWDIAYVLTGTYFNRPDYPEIRAKLMRLHAVKCGPPDEGDYL